MGKLVRSGIAVCVAVGSIGSGTASGTAVVPSDRADYVGHLEQICAPGASATKRALKGARANVQRGNLKRAGAQFAAASRIFHRTIRGISAVPRPPADSTTLAEWFGDLNRQGHYLEKISWALRTGHKVRSQGYLARFIHYGNLGNNDVLSFGFHACRFDATRYG